MKESLSPEEKLLRLIREQKKEVKIIPEKKAEFQAANTQLSSSVGRKFTLDSLFSLLPQSRIPYAQLTQFITLAFILSCIFLIAAFIYPWIGLRQIRLPLIAETEKTKEEKFEIGKEIKPYDFYLQGVKDRQIFRSTVTGEGGKPTQGPAANIDLTKDISLIGIISGDDPQAVIEDKKNQKTYYLTKGQFIGELEVKEILEGKVILDYNGKSIELHL